MAILPLLLAAILGVADTTAPARPDSADPRMGPGVSHALATARAANIRKVRYDVRLNVVERDTARGHVTLRFTLGRRDDVIVDFRGPRLEALVVNGRAYGTREGGALPAGWYNGAHLRIPASALRAGANEVQARFASRIAPAGASIIRYHDEADRSEYLYTLLVPSDANALFPCFDQPDMKARLTLALTVRHGWSAIANGVTERAEPAGDSATTVYFRESEPLPTYLFAFAAGPWRTLEGTTRPTPLLVRATRVQEVERDSLQDQVASALDSFERFFGVTYPFQQFQHLLAPAFPFGGMEHPGVTMFNEESFIYREPPTLTQRLGRRATIYHEVAHQWFGDYVTMRWFDDLWLKEGFATYMAAKMQEIEGQPNPWMSFYLRNKPLAYDVDRTAGTTPVWQSLANLDQAKSNYGPIVYNKAPGILKQLNYLVGDSAFRAGVHDFLVTHAYGNATWRDLLAAIGRAAHRDLVPWGEQYILRPGMPVLEQQLQLRDGRIARLTLAQRPASALSGAGNWPIRTEVVLWRAGSTPVSIPVELTGARVEVPGAVGLPAPDFVFANANDHAYALVMLDDRSAGWLEQHVGEVPDTFLRAMLWGAMWDLVRDARLAPDRYLAMLLRELPRERDEQVAAGLLGRAGRVITSYLSRAQRDAGQPAAESLLLAQASDSTRPYGIRKGALDLYVDVARTPGARARLLAWLDSTSAAGLPLRQPTRWAIVTTLAAGAHQEAAALIAREAARDSVSGKRRAFIAGAAFPDAAVKRDYFTRYFADSTLNEEWATASLGAFNDPAQAALTLPWLTPALDSLLWIQRNRRIFYLGSWIASFMRGQQSPEALQAVDGFLAAHPALPADLRQKVLQSRDELERTVRIRERYAAVIPSEAGDFTLPNFHFRSGETLPALRIHYVTLGRPRRDAKGVVRNAVLMLHGTTGSGTGLVAPMSPLFAPGAPLDTATHYVIFPDGIGHGASSKPSDGMRVRFPKYTYDDMVEAQYRLLTEGLGVNHLRLILGTSMGCMHAWIWGEEHPGFVDGLVPLACAPAAIAGRNRMIRRMIIDDIEQDPEWTGGDYERQPVRGLRAAMGQLFIMTSAPLVQQRQFPTRAAADSGILAYLDRQARTHDANDVIYAFDASRDYDPSARLEAITARVLAINSADDFVNPPELGLMERLIPRVRHAQYILIPTSAATRGHGTHSQPAIWGAELARFLRALPER
ncbi:MAG TPA: alpha/beta fold hydrolase [Gemmatimonadaceae bacterium]